MKKIAYISGTRADFGLMTPVLWAIEKSSRLNLQVYATGIHLMKDFGFTFNEVRKEFPRVKKIEATFKSDDRIGTAGFTGEFMGRFVETLAEDKPDFLLVLGDRIEMLCAAVACLYLRIPVGQLHGGDRSSTVDELARHAITKLSHIHFPATVDAGERIKKMGEDDWRGHVVGAPALDIILNKQLPTREELFKKLGLDPKNNVILVTQHPVSEEIEDAGFQMEETLSAVKTFNLPVVVTYPHADAGGRKIIEVIDREKGNSQFRIFPSLTYKDFLALERECAVWVGNSSGTMIESSSFQTPVVEVGERQKDREHGDNLIKVGYDRRAISAAIDKSLNDREYLLKLTKIKNPWGDGKTGPRVVQVLEDLKIDSRLLNKQISY